MNISDISELLSVGKNSLDIISLLDSKENIEARDYLIKLIEDNKLDEAEAYKIAMIANSGKIVKKLKNMLKIHQKRDKLLLDNNISLEMNQEKSLEQSDWQDYFDELCSNVSSEDMQNIWSKILAKETVAPGSISKVMLNTFALLDLKSADCFGKLCDLTFMFDEKDKEIRYIPLILYDDILHDIEEADFVTEELKNALFEYSKYVPAQKDIEYLSELGLVKITGSDFVSDIYSWSEINAKLSVQDEFVFVKGCYEEEDNRFHIDVGQVLFTQVGLSLFNAISGGKTSFPHLFDVLQAYIKYQES